MVRCDGARAGYKMLCNGSLYQCVCGEVGCTQNKPELCTNQGFDASGKCVKCGAVGKRELLAPEAVGFIRSLMGDPRPSVGT